MYFDRSVKPKSKDQIDFSLPSIKRNALENELFVYFVEKNNLPIIQLTLIIEAGSKFDPKGKEGLSLLTSSLIDEGAGKYSALELDDKIESLGSILNIITDHDAVFISLLSLKENFSESLSILSDILTDPHFTEEDFQREKTKHLTKLIQLKDQPSYIADTEFEKIIYSDHPYGNPTMGFTESIQQIENKDVIEFFEKYYSVNNSSLAVVGNIEEEHLIDELNSTIAGWNNKNFIKMNNLVISQKKKEFFLINKADAAQSEIRLGHITKGRNHEDYFDRVVANTILGGQFSSRINLNLREDKGYTYGAHSSIKYNKLSGDFCVSSSVEGKHTKNSIVEVIKEIEGLRKEITEEEIEFAKSYLIRKYPSQFETYSSIARNLAKLILFELPMDYYNTYVKNVEKVTKESLSKTVQDIFKPEYLTILAVGNEESIKIQLKEITNKINLIEAEL